jgi:hypothetical protein
MLSTCALSLSRITACGQLEVQRPEEGLPATEQRVEAHIECNLTTINGEMGHV